MGRWCEWRFPSTRPSSYPGRGRRTRAWPRTSAAAPCTASRSPAPRTSRTSSPRLPPCTSPTSRESLSVSVWLRYKHNDPTDPPTKLYILHYNRTHLQYCIYYIITELQYPVYPMTIWVACMYNVQCIRKVFTALHFFHILLCYSLIPKLNKFIFSSKFYTQHPIMTTWKKFFFKCLQIY